MVEETGMLGNIENKNAREYKNQKWKFKWGGKKGRERGKRRRNKRKEGRELDEIQTVGGGRG